MQKNKRALTLVVVILTITILTIASLYGQSQNTFSIVQQPSNQLPPVTSRVSGLEIIGTEILEERSNSVLVRYTVQNISDQPITAFGLANGNGSVIIDYYAGIGDTQEILEPNATKNVDYPLSKEEITLPLRIAVAFYADGNSEGEELYRNSIRGSRVGFRRQLIRLLPILQQQALNSQARRLSYEQTIENVRAEVARFPRSSTANLNEGNESVGGIQILDFELVRLQRRMIQRGDAEAELQNFISRLQALEERLGR